MIDAPRPRFLPGWVVVIAVVIAFLSVGSTVLIAIKSSTDKTKATEDFVAQIQNERRRNIREGCEQQNARHDNVIKTLDSVIAKLPKANRMKAEQSKAGTVLILEALAPHRDCVKVVQQQAGARVPG